MAQSMTGFGSAEKNGCKVEIRSLNSRFMDVYIKAPAFLNQFDIQFRNLLKERFARGKFDVTIVVAENASVDFKINTDVADKVCSSFKKLQEDLSLSGNIDINMMAGFHHLYLKTDNVYNEEALNEVFMRAILNLTEMRNREGDSLAGELLSMADTLGSVNDRIKDLKMDVREITEKLRERLTALLAGKDFDDNRILQEATLMVMKLDISEELARIDSHVKQFREILLGSDIVGRKLDFVVQELNREINTIASKSADYAISSLTVEMKAITEKIKEQVQNIQ